MTRPAGANPGPAPPSRPRALDLIGELHRLDGTFPNREQRVADYVLARLGEIAHLRQDEIAAGAGVSVATVSRFCQTLGCEGFRDFRVAIARSAAVSLQYLDAADEPPSPAGKLAAQVFGALADTLTVARSQLDHATVQRAIDALADSKRIVFVGVGGNSANVAREGANRFFRLGIAAEAHADGWLQRMLASTLGPGDALFAISSSGTPAELVDSAAIAAQYGAATLALTRPGSPLAVAADVAIGLDLPEDQDIYKPTASRLAFLATVDVLAAGVARTRPDAVKEHLRRIRTAMVPLSEGGGPRPIGD